MMNLFPMQREEHVPQFSNPNGLVSDLFLGFSKVLGCKFWPGTLSHRTFQAFLYSQVYAYSSDHRFLIPTRKYWFCFHWFGCGFIWLSGYNYLVESFLPAKETCFVSWVILELSRIHDAIWITWCHLVPLDHQAHNSPKPPIIHHHCSRYVEFAQYALLISQHTETYREQFGSDLIARHSSSFSSTDA